jgi:hypothetical protein
LSLAAIYQTIQLDRKGMKIERLEDWDAPPADAPKNWPQQRGRAFEKIIKRLLGEAGLEPRSSFRPSGEEIDGSFVLGDRTYLLEAKWHKEPIPASDLYTFKGKVDGKLVGTIGVYISMSDYSPQAIDALKFGKEINLILFGERDFRLVEEGRISFPQAMRRKLRYAAESGQPYLPLGPDESVEPQNAQSQPGLDESWDVVVEGMFDELSLRIVFERLGIGESVRLWTAGGQLGVPSLVRQLRESGHQNIAAVIESDAPSKLLEHLKEETAEASGHLVIMNPSVEEWLYDACSADYINAIPPTSIVKKNARRLAENADLCTLLSANPDFEALVNKITGKT